MSINRPSSEGVCRRQECNQAAGFNGLCIDCWFEWSKYIVAKEKPQWILDLPPQGTPTQKAKSNNSKSATLCQYDFCGNQTYSGIYCIEHSIECNEPKCQERVIVSEGKCAKHQPPRRVKICKLPDCEAKSGAYQYCPDHRRTCLVDTCAERKLTGKYCAQHQAKCRARRCTSHELTGKYCKRHRTPCAQSKCRDRELVEEGFCKKHCHTCAVPDCVSRELLGEYCEHHQNECRVLTCEETAVTELVLCGQHHQFIVSEVQHELLERKCMIEWCESRSCTEADQDHEYCQDHQLYCRVHTCEEIATTKQVFCESHEEKFSEDFYAMPARKCLVRACESQACASRDLLSEFCINHQNTCRVFTCDKVGNTDQTLCKDHDEIISKNPRAQGMARRCLVGFCQRKAKTNEWCNGHEHQSRRGKEFTPIRDAYPETCTIEGCERAHYSSYLCDYHYNQKQRGVEFHELLVFPDTCQLEDCEEPFNCQDLCKKHYRTWQKIKAKLETDKAPAWSENQRLVYFFVINRDPSKSYGNLVQVDKTWRLKPPPAA